MNNKIICNLILAGVWSLAMLSCEKLPEAHDTVPQLSSLSEYDVQAESVVLTAWSDYKSSDSYFRIAQVPDTEWSAVYNAHWQYGSEGGIVYSAEIAGLLPGEKYYFQFVLVGSHQGEEMVSEWQAFVTDTQYHQTIIWNQSYNVYLGEDPLTLEAWATSSLPVYYEITEGFECAVLDGEYYQYFYPIKDGTVIVTANQPGGVYEDKEYYPANPVSKKIEIVDRKIIISDVVVDEWGNNNGGNWNAEI